MISVKKEFLNYNNDDIKEKLLKNASKATRENEKYIQQMTHDSKINLRIIELKNKKTAQRSQNNLLTEIMSKHTTIIGKQIHIWKSEANGTISSPDKKRTSLWHIMLKIPKFYHKDKILKSVGQKQ